MSKEAIAEKVGIKLEIGPGKLKAMADRTGAFPSKQVIEFDAIMKGEEPVKNGASHFFTHLALAENSVGPRIPGGTQGGICSCRLRTIKV